MVKMELSLTRMPTQGWRGSEVAQISVFFEDLFQNLKKRCPRCHFWRFFCQKGSKGIPKGTPNPPKVEWKWSPGFARFPFGCQIPPRRGSGVRKVPKSYRKSIILMRGFLWNFSDRLLCKWLFLAVTELCFDMYTSLLCSSAVHCIEVLSAFFCGVWALMLSSPSLCLTREWSLPC